MPPKKRDSVPDNRSIAKKRSKTSNIRSDEIEERDNYCNVNILPDPDDSGESDFSDSEEHEQYETDYESSENENGESENENSLPQQSYHTVSENYNCSQKKLEEKHEYTWLNGEKSLNNEHLSYENEILLKTEDVKMILQSSPTNLFEFFFSLKLKNYIIEATSNNGLILSMDELDAFLGILLFTTYNKRHSERDYWSKDNFLYAQPVKNAMSRNKFLEIKRRLKFHKPGDANNSDRAWRVRKILDIFRKNLFRFGTLGTALLVDEMMLKFFGRTVLKQFIRGKPIRFGIKMWALCVSNGYLLDCDIYCGKETDNDKKLSKVAMGSRVVLKMLQKVLESVSARNIHKYHVYFDNLFTSPDLLLHLQKLGFKASGTVRENRVPVKHSITKKAIRGTHEIMHDKNSNLQFITVKDSKPVSILSTAAGITPLCKVKRHTEKKKEKEDLLFPNAFCVYNKFMGGVDLHDQRCNNISPIVRSKKWTWVIFLRLIQSSVTNAVILYNTAAQGKNKKATKDFAMAISKCYLTKESTKKLQSHSIENQMLLKNCTKNCSKRTRKFCVNCQLYYCDTCFKSFHKI